jgi:hypothetical protein
MVFDLKRNVMSGYLGGKDMAAPGSSNEVSAPAKPVQKAVTMHSLQAMRAAGDRIAMLTCYDASFASLMDRCGVEILLIGDSLGMVCAGYDSTLPVTVADVAYHTASVVRGRKNALVLADLPFGSYGTKEQAYDNCAVLMRAGAQMIKIEGGAWLAETVRFLVERGIPVCAHIGLTPQFVHQLGGYKVQGKTMPAPSSSSATPGPAGRRRRHRAAGSRAGRAGQGSDGDAARADHRHRRRSRLLGPGAGDARPAGRLPGPQGALREELHGRPDQHRRARSAPTSPPSRTAASRHRNTASERSIGA